MTSRRIEGHKNYYDVMKKHQRGSRLKRLLKLVLLFLFFVLLMGSVYFITKMLKEDDLPTIENEQVSKIISRPDISEYVLFKSKKNGKT